MAKLKQDWAKQTAEQLFRKHPLAVTIDVVVRVLRRARKLKEAERKVIAEWEYERGKAVGYAEGYNEQMRARVLDAMERLSRSQHTRLKLQQKASGHCTCDGGNTNCATCAAESKLRKIGQND